MPNVSNSIPSCHPKEMGAGWSSECTAMLVRALLLLAPLPVYEHMHLHCIVYKDTWIELCL